MISTTRLIGSIHDHRKCRKQSEIVLENKPKKKKSTTTRHVPVPVSQSRPLSAFITKSRRKIHKLLLPKKKFKTDDDASVPLLPV